MKTNQISLPLLLLAAFIVAIGCQKEDALSRQATDHGETAFGLSIEEVALKLPEAERADFIASHMEREMPRKRAISYLERVCSEVPINGNLPYDGEDFYVFLAQAGDSVSIGATRTDCGLDPAIFLWYGSAADTDSLLLLGIADDNVAPPASCVDSCVPFADPYGDLIIPFTGYYTVSVWEFISEPCLEDGGYELNIYGAICNVIIDGCDSGVLDLLLDNGMTITESIAACADGAANHGEFVSCVTQLTNQLKKDGLISGAEKGAIQSCAAGSGFPL